MPLVFTALRSYLAKEFHINTNSAMIACIEKSLEVSDTSDNSASRMASASTSVTKDDSDSIIAILEDIARDKQERKKSDLASRANPLSCDELWWNVGANDIDEQRIAAGMPLQSTFGSLALPPIKEQSMVLEPEMSGTIVLAEDDEATRMLLHRVLSRAGFTVHACENGQLACQEVQLNGADVVLLDWMMPVMDGPAAVAYLKGNVDTRAIPVVMLTTQSRIDERVVALQTGVQDFLTKPFNTRELVARISQQMRWRRMLAIDANRPSLEKGSSSGFV